LDTTCDRTQSTPLSSVHAFFCVFRIIIFQKSPDAFLEAHIQSQFVRMLQIRRRWCGSTGCEPCIMGIKRWATSRSTLVWICEQFCRRFSSSGVHLFLNEVVNYSVPHTTK
jgi:hypothetical protein